MATVVDFTQHDADGMQ